jgi:hypothetical protein
MPERKLRTENGFELTKFKKFLLKIFCITYILELILLCRLMADVVLHTCYNMYHIDYVNNEATFGLIFNHVVSVVALCVLVYELMRLIFLNRSFAHAEIAKRRDLAEELIEYQRLPTEEDETAESEDEESSEYETDDESSDHEAEAVVWSKNEDVTKHRGNGSKKDEDDLDLLGDEPDGEFESGFNPKVNASQKKKPKKKRKKKKKEKKPTNTGNSLLNWMRRKKEELEKPVKEKKKRTKAGKRFLKKM